MSSTANEIARLLGGTSQAGASQLLADISRTQQANANTRTIAQALELYNSRGFQESLEAQRVAAQEQEAWATRATAELGEMFQAYGDDANQRGLLGTALFDFVQADVVDKHAQAVKRAGSDPTAIVNANRYYAQMMGQFEASWQNYASSEQYREVPVDERQMAQRADKGFATEFLRTVAGRVASFPAATASVASALGSGAVGLIPDNAGDSARQFGDSLQAAGAERGQGGDLVGMASQGLGNVAGAIGRGAGRVLDALSSSGAQEGLQTTAQRMADKARSVNQRFGYNDANALAQQLEARQTRERFDSTDKELGDYVDFFGDVVGDSLDADFLQLTLGNLAGDVLSAGGAGRLVRMGRGLAPAATAPGIGGALRRQGAPILLAGQAQEFTRTPDGQTPQEAVARVATAGAEAAAGGLMSSLGLGRTLESALSGGGRGSPLSLGGALTGTVRGGIGEAGQESVGGAGGTAADIIGRAAQEDPGLGFRGAFDTLSTPESVSQMLMSGVEGAGGGLVAGAALRGPAELAGRTMDRFRPVAPAAAPAAAPEAAPVTPDAFNSADRNPDGLTPTAAAAAQDLNLTPGTEGVITGDESAPLPRATVESQYGGQDINQRVATTRAVIESLLGVPGTDPALANAQLIRDANAFGFRGQAAADYARGVQESVIASRTRTEDGAIVPPSTNRYLQIVGEVRNQIEGLDQNVVPPAAQPTTVAADVDAVGSSTLAQVNQAPAPQTPAPQAPQAPPPIPTQASPVQTPPPIPAQASPVQTPPPIPAQASPAPASQTPPPIPAQAPASGQRTTEQVQAENQRRADEIRAQRDAALRQPAQDASERRSALFRMSPEELDSTIEGLENQARAVNTAAPDARERIGELSSQIAQARDIRVTEARFNDGPSQLGPDITIGSGRGVQELQAIADSFDGMGPRLNQLDPSAENRARQRLIEGAASAARGSGANDMTPREQAILRELWRGDLPPEQVAEAFIARAEQAGQEGPLTTGEQAQLDQIIQGQLRALPLLPPEPAPPPPPPPRRNRTPPPSSLITPDVVYAGTDVPGAVPALPPKLPVAEEAARVGSFVQAAQKAVARFGPTDARAIEARRQAAASIAASQAAAPGQRIGEELTAMLSALEAQSVALDSDPSQAAIAERSARATELATLETDIDAVGPVAESALRVAAQIAPAEQAFTAVLERVVEQSRRVPTLVRTRDESDQAIRVNDLIKKIQETFRNNPALASLKGRVDALDSLPPRQRIREGLTKPVVQQVLRGAELIPQLKALKLTKKADKQVVSDLESAVATAGEIKSGAASRSESNALGRQLTDVLQKADALIASKKKAPDASANRVSRERLLDQEPDGREYATRVTVGAQRGRLLDSLDQAPRPGSTAESTPRAFISDVRTVNRIATALMQGWPSRPTTDVRASYSDFPKAVRDSLERQGLAPDADFVVRAATYDGKVYVAADYFNSERDVQFTLLEEMLGHQGLRKRYGPNIHTELNNLFRTLGGLDGVLAAGTRFGLDLAQDYRPLVESIRRGDARAPDARRALVEELLAQGVARQALEPRVLSVARRIMQRVRIWLRSRVPGMRRALDTYLTDADLLTIMREAAWAGRNQPEAAFPLDAARANRTRRGGAFAVATGRAGGRTQWRAVGAFGDGVNTEGATVPDQIRTQYSQVRDTARTLLDGGRDIGKGRRRAKFLESPTWIAVQKALQNSRAEAKVVARRIYKAIGEGVYDAARVADDLFSPTRNTDGTWKTHAGLYSGNRFAAILNPARRPATSDEGAGTIDSQALTEMMDVEQQTSLHARAQDRLRRDSDQIQKNLVRRVDELAAYLGGISQRDAERSADSYFKARHAPERNATLWALDGARLSSVDHLRRIEIAKALVDPIPIGRDPDSYLQGLHLELQQMALRAANIEERAAYSASGLTDAQAMLVISSAENVSGKSAAVLRQKYDNIYAELSAMHALTDTYQTEAGSFSRTYDQARRAYNWQHYVPLKGGQRARELFSTVPGMLRQVDSLDTQVHLARGRESEADNVVENTLRDLAQAAEHNADQAINRAVMLNVAATNSSTEHAFVTKGLWQGRVRRYDINGPNFAKINRSSKANRVIYFDPGNLANGQGKQYAWVTELATKAAVDAAKGSRATDLEKAMHKYKLTQALSFATGMMTRYNVNFLGVNVLRDMISSAAILGAEVTPAAALDMVSSMLFTRQSGVVGKYVFHYQRGEYDKIDAMVAADREGIAKQLDTFFRVGGRVTFAQQFGDGRQTEDRFGGNQAERAFRKLNASFNYLNDTAEILTRFAVFRTLVNQGYSNERAASYAKNVANFENVGQYGGVLGGLYGFFRASATGSVRFIESLMQGKNGPVVAAVMFGAGIALYSLALALAPEDEEGNNVIATGDKSQWTRAVQFVFGDNELLSLPVGFGYGGTIAMGSQIAAFLSGHQSFSSLVDNSARVITDNISPMQPSGISLSERPQLAVLDTFTPTLLKPWLQFVTNVNTWGADVRDDFSPNYGGINDALGGRPGTFDTVYREITDALFEAGVANIAPETLKHFSNSYTLGIAQVSESVFEWYKLASGDDPDYVADKKRALLGLRSFINEPLSTVPGQYYRAQDMILSLKRQRTELEKQGFMALAEEFDASHPGLAQLESYLSEARSVVNKQTEAARALRISDASRGQKQQGIEEFTEITRAAQARFLQRLPEEYQVR